MRQMRRWSKFVANLIRSEQPRRRRGAAGDVVVEALERRVLLTEFLVTTTDDVIAEDGFVSLREAVQAANTNTAVGDAPAGAVDGDVIRFSDALTPRTIDLTLGELAITEDVTIEGEQGGRFQISSATSRLFNINTDEEVRLRHLTLTGGATVGFGGVIANAGGGTTYLDEVSVLEGRARLGGGGLFNSGGTVIISGSRFSNNNLVGSDPGVRGGGAIFNVAGGRLSIRDSEISRNTAIRSGGGIQNSSHTERGISLSRVTIDSNRVENVPGGYLESIGGGGLRVDNGGHAVIVNCTITNNFASGSGGGLSNGTGRMLIRSTTVSRNFAGARDGGGVDNNGGNINIDHSWLLGNRAGHSGGGLSSSGVVTVDTSVISTNHALKAGGGVSIRGVLNLVASSLQGNNTRHAVTSGGSYFFDGLGGGLRAFGTHTTVHIRGSLIAGNGALGNGGGIWNGQGSRLFVTQTTIAGNRAIRREGGGIYNDRGTVYLSNVFIVNNEAKGPHGSGGGIFTNYGSMIVSASTIVENVARRSGGGVGIDNGRFYLSSSVLDRNTVLIRRLKGSAGQGAGLYASGDSQVHLFHCHVRGNFASQRGGGLWNGAGSSMRVERTTVRGNRAVGDAEGDGGGGIYNDGGSLAVIDSTIRGNATRGKLGSGGGIYSAAGAVHVNHTIIESNFARDSGGGVAIVAGTFGIVDSSVVRGNVTSAQAPAPSGNGGGVHVAGANVYLNVSDSVISRNNAANEGGGIWIHDGSRLNILRSIVAYNRAFGMKNGRGGGGLLNDGSSIVIDASTIFDNSTAGAGGGLYLDAEGTARIARTRIAENHAVGRGGGIYNDDELALEAALVVMNSAGNGGGVFTDANGVTSVSNSTVSGNMPNDFAGPGNVT